MIERTDFVSVPVQDLERGAKFYGETLGIKRNEKAHGSFPEFETGNVTLCLIDPTKIGGEFSANRNHIALRVADVAETRARLEADGVEFHGETLDTGVCFMAFFADPDGNVLMLHHRYEPYSDSSMP